MIEPMKKPEQALVEARTALRSLTGVRHLLRQHGRNPAPPADELDALLGAVEQSIDRALTVLAHSLVEPETA